MIRVRLHGRGGQGMKTASRVLGTAALLAGLEAQDSPVYGAERRGAPLVAFVRLGPRPIRERGGMPAPDLCLVADDTLLDDPAAEPLRGLPPDGVLLLSSVHAAEEVRAHVGHPGPIVVRDFLTLALDAAGSVGGLSTALAAAGAALIGLPDGAVDRALEEELAAIGLAPARRAAGRRLAALARAGLAAEPRLAPAAEAGPGGLAPAPPAALADVRYVPSATGAPSVLAGANTPLRRTGSWRVYRPEIDLARCTRCWVCYLRCPDGAIALDPDGTPHVDYAVCKGCLTCAEECPVHGIARVREARTWAEAPA
jgi:pyruvate ferredoxin oxidoreductase gamma subunit